MSQTARFRRLNSSGGSRGERYVVGGELAGLTEANALTDAGNRVTLLEQSRNLGGRARLHARRTRSLSELTVTEGLPGTEGRPEVDRLRIDNVEIADDWVSTEGMLSDAAVASSLRATEVVRQSAMAAA